MTFPETVLDRVDCRAKVLDIGTRLGPYEITGRLGAGGMGQVFKARDTRLNRTVAIKVANAAFTAWFEREARAVAALNHPNICQLHDVGPNYLVLEHIAGAPVLPTDNVRKLLDIAVQIADSMAAAHEAGFVHRDLKPSNLLVTAEGRVKILDFGLVKSVAPEPGPDGGPALTVTAHGLVAGTTAYMSPEQARGEATLDARSDQFSYGLVLYELATGNRPFDRATGIETLAAIVRDDPDPLPPKIPAPLRWIIGRCLAKEPRDRYASSRDLYLELKSVQAHFADASATDGQAALTGAPARRRRWRGAATFAGGVALTVVVAWALGVRAPREGPDLRVTPFSSEAADKKPPCGRPTAGRWRTPRGNCRPSPTRCMFAISTRTCRGKSRTRRMMLFRSSGPPPGTSFSGRPESSRRSYRSEASLNPFWSFALPLSLYRATACPSLTTRPTSRACGEYTCARRSQRNHNGTSRHRSQRQRQAGFRNWHSLPTASNCC